MVRARAREQFRKHDISLHTIGAYGIYSFDVIADIHHVQIGVFPLERMRCFADVCTLVGIFLGYIKLK